MDSKVFATFSTILLAIVLAAGVGLYARGYVFSPTAGGLNANGHFVIKSHPDGAEVYIDGELETATNANLRLAPKTYDVEVRKEGYYTWSKRIEIQKEEVTEITAHLFRTAPSLSAITFSGIESPTPSRDFTKIAYVIPDESAGLSENAGLWVMETLNLPVGFSREPRQVTDGNLTNATFVWSPNGRQIMVSTSTATFVVDAGTFTPQAQRVNMTTAQVLATRQLWREEETKRIEEELRTLPVEFADLLEGAAGKMIFSPDEDMVLYEASESATLAERYIPEIPGSSSQEETRYLDPGGVYVYDIEEDKNFKVTTRSGDTSECILNTPAILLSCDSTIAWFPTSRHLMLAQPEKIDIVEYDGANTFQAYSGSYTAPYALPITAIDRIIILTNLGATSSPSNLYSVSIK